MQLKETKRSFKISVRTLSNKQDPNGESMYAVDIYKRDNDINHYYILHQYTDIMTDGIKNFPQRLMSTAKQCICSEKFYTGTFEHYVIDPSTKRKAETKRIISEIKRDERRRALYWDDFINSGISKTMDFDDYMHMREARPWRFSEPCDINYISSEDAKALIETKREAVAELLEDIKNLLKCL